MDIVSENTQTSKEIHEPADGSNHLQVVKPGSPQGKKDSIISRREIEPLLAKARQVLMYYNEAVSCQAAVLDKNGFIVSTTKSKPETPVCEFCRKNLKNPHGVQTKADGGERSECPCEKIHFEAQAESRRIEGTYIYTCKQGLVYWTCPLYRNGRYAGTLTAGPVLSGEPEIILEKFRAACRDRSAAEELREILENMPRKSHEEIQAMARLLGVCAEEISEKGEDSGDMIRRIAWLDEFPKIPGDVGTQRLKISESSLPAASAHTHVHGQGKWTDDSEYPLEKERLLLAAFRRGDNETGARILNELMDNIRYAIPLNFEIVRFRAIELAVLLSRAAVTTENSGDSSMFETNDRYLRRILESKSPEELIENLHLAAERLSGKIFSFQGVRHASVLRKAERYIWENYTRKISLEEISKASGLSAPYFSTIFKEEMGENLSSYLNRLRVERAAVMLTETGKSLNEIAGRCGFEDHSWFSKIFKNFTGMSPGKFRETGSRSLECKPVRNRPTRGMVFPDVVITGQNKQNLLSS